MDPFAAALRFPLWGSCLNLWLICNMWALTKGGGNTSLLQHEAKRVRTSPNWCWRPGRVTGWRETHLRTAFRVSSCFGASFLPIHHDSFFLRSKPLKSRQIQPKHSPVSSEGTAGVKVLVPCCVCPSVHLSVCPSVGYLCLVAGSKQNSSAGWLCCLYWRNLPVWLQRVSHQRTHEGEPDPCLSGPAGKRGPD